MARKRGVLEDTLFGKDDEVLARRVKSFTITSATSEQFYMTFTKFMAPIFNIKSANDIKVLGMLCAMMDYNSAKVYLTTERREEICATANIVNSVLSRSLASLKDLGIVSGDKGTLEISPFIFWKGNTEDRMRLLKKGGLTLKLKFKVEDEETGKIYPNYKYDDEK